MASPTIKFSNGYTFPIIGLGTYKSNPGEVEQAIKDAIEVGYRHFDCAYMYGNESEVGAAIREKINDGTVKREDIFVTSKLWNTFHSKELVVPSLKQSLENLGLDYLDLYLIHWPYGFKEGGELIPMIDDVPQFSDVDYLDTWKGMEECVHLGLTRSIGLSNFNSDQIDRILANSQIAPVNNQVECNPNLNQKKLIEFCRQREIIVTGFCPLGRPAQTTGIEGKPQSSIQEPRIAEIGQKYGKSPAQIVLRYLVSLGIAVVPKSVTKSRIIDNINIFDFELTKDEIAFLDSLNQNIRVCPSTEFKEHKYYPFNIEF
ncbi:uncharacterized protein CBL_00828 [Carabus blaptoides fortunei]